MKTKILSIVLLIGFFSTVTAFSQQKKQTKVKHDSTKMDMNHSKVKNKNTYVCPMHSAIQSDTPGKCSECGMNLKKIKPIYTCPMHPDIKNSQPSKCPKCGMNLTLKELEKNKKGEHKHLKN